MHYKEYIFKIGKFDIHSIESDASKRYYERVIFSDEKSLILGHYKNSDETIESFVNSTKILKDFNIKVPEIFFIDKKEKVIIMEDFGNIKMSNFILRNNDKKEIIDIYLQTIDLLTNLQRKSINFNQNLKIQYYNVEKKISVLHFFVNNYLRKFRNFNIDENFKEKFKKIMHKILKQNLKLNKTIILRDFHVDNIMILKNNSIGIIDYQDISIGSPVYDFISIMEDVRIDIDENIKNTCVKKFSNDMNFDKELFKFELSAVSIQRNMRILGVFAKLIEEKSDKYKKFIPRCEEYVRKRLKNSETFTELNKLFEEYSIKI